MHLLAFKEYVILFLLVLLTGCMGAPNVKKNVEGCNAGESKQSVAKKKLSREELLAASKEIDRLEAEIALQQSKFKRRPRRYFVGARAKDADVALYMEAWRAKVEKFGNENYPEEVQNLYGKVQLTTSIKSDGSFEKAELDKSSGCKVLDDHALHIVRNAAPYAAFSKSMKKRFDILGITQTFTYTKESALLPKSGL